MDDEELELTNACTDLVSAKKWEAFPTQLLQDERAGEWVGVQRLCRQLGLDVGGLKEDLFAAWLPDPMDNDAYVVIVFYDDESKWTMAAHYHRQRLLAGGQPAKEQPAGDARQRNKV
jgi:hypothetical protein